MINDIKDQELDFYQSRLRVLFIIYFFSQSYCNPEEPHRKTIFETEVRIQKIDFLIRNPDYLAYELLSLAKETKLENDHKIRFIVKRIFKDNEPILRKREMERFFFGAYEDLDDIIAFLKAYGLIEFESEKSTSGYVIGKKYFVTSYGENKIINGLTKVPAITWYSDRCKLINEYFGSLSGNELKMRQYQIQKYNDTPLHEHIDSVEKEANRMYVEMYGEALV